MVVMMENCMLCVVIIAVLGIYEKGTKHRNAKNMNKELYDVLFNDVFFQCLYTRWKRR